jgi:AraC-like DNA-binding protein
VPLSFQNTLSESLAKLSGLTIELPMMEYYLDEERHARFWRRMAPNYQGEPELWFLIGRTIGWSAWNQLKTAALKIDQGQRQFPRVTTMFHASLALACAPIVIDGHVVAEVTTRPVILADQIDWDWHRAWAHEHGVDWDEYLSAERRSLHKTRDQMEGAAAMIGIIGNTIATLAHHLATSEDSLAKRTQRSRDAVERAIDYMRDHLETPITVAEVARHVNLNPSTFCMMFSGYTGQTPSDYLINLRIARAEQLLAHTTMSVVDISEALGYDPSHFSRLFRHRTGYAPGRYARMMRI